MEVEEWQDTQSSLPGSEEEEEEVVSQSRRPATGARSLLP